MSDNQTANEVKYKVALKLLDIMLRNGIISPAEYKKIDELNRESFTILLCRNNARKDMMGGEWLSLTAMPILINCLMSHQLSRIKWI